MKMKIILNDDQKAFEHLVSLENRTPIKLLEHKAKEHDPKTDSFYLINWAQKEKKIIFIIYIRTAKNRIHLFIADNFRELHAYFAVKYNDAETRKNEQERLSIMEVLNFLTNSRKQMIEHYGVPL